MTGLSFSFKCYFGAFKPFLADSGDRKGTWEERGQLHATKVLCQNQTAQ